MEEKVSIEGRMFDHISNDLFKVVVVVVGEFYATILRTSSEVYSVRDIDENEIRNE